MKPDNTLQKKRQSIESLLAQQPRAGSFLHGLRDKFRYLGHAFGGFGKKKAFATGIFLSAAAVSVMAYSSLDAISNSVLTAFEQVHQYKPVKEPVVGASVSVSEPIYNNEKLEIIIAVSDASKSAEKFEVYSGNDKFIQPIFDGNGFLAISLPANPQNLQLKIYSGRLITYSIALKETKPGRLIEERRLLEPEKSIEEPVVVNPGKTLLTIGEEHNSPMGMGEVVRTILPERNKHLWADAVKALFPDAPDTMYGTPEGVVKKPNMDGIPDPVIHFGDTFELTKEWMEEYGITADSPGIKNVPDEIKVNIKKIPAKYASITSFEKPEYGVDVRETKPVEIKPYGLTADITDSDVSLEQRVSTSRANKIQQQSASSRSASLPRYTYKKIALDDLDLLVHLYEETDMTIKQIQNIISEGAGMNVSTGTFYRIIDKILGKGMRRRDNSSVTAYEAYMEKMDSFTKPLMKLAA